MNKQLVLSIAAGAAILGLCVFSAITQAQLTNAERRLRVLQLDVDATHLAAQRRDEVLWKRIDALTDAHLATSAAVTNMPASGDDSMASYELKNDVDELDRKVRDLDRRMLEQESQRLLQR